MGDRRASGDRPVVAIDVRPLLLGGALARLLRGDDIDVVLVPEGITDADTEHRYDLVVTSQPSPSSSSSLILRVVESDADLGRGDDARDDVVDVRLLADVLERIDGWRAELARRDRRGVGLQEVSGVQIE